MIVAALRSRLRRVLAVLSVSLFAATATVVLSAAPAHAALVYEGTFTMRPPLRPPFPDLCAGPQNNGTARQTPIVMQNCDGSSGQRWAIFLDTSTNRRWIQAHGGAFPLNMCMDVNAGTGPSPVTYLWNCNGGRNQQFSLSPGSLSQFIFGNFTDTNGQGMSFCLNMRDSTTVGAGLTLQNCGKQPFISGSLWRMVPA